VACQVGQYERVVGTAAERLIWVRPTVVRQRSLTPSPSGALAAEELKSGLKGGLVELSGGCKYLPR
jgi:hypothetical protein